MSAPSGARASGPWYQGVTAEQWRAFFAAYLGWMLDGFDFTILTFLLVEIQHTFTVNSALAGALGTATLLLRVVGGIGAGTAADRWGRKGPLMGSILWYSIFAFLGGFSTSYGALFMCRALFGIGMGGVWAAGMPLALEHWPARLRRQHHLRAAVGNTTRATRRVWQPRSASQRSRCSPSPRARRRYWPARHSSAHSAPAISAPSLAT